LQNLSDLIFFIFLYFGEKFLMTVEQETSMSYKIKQNFNYYLNFWQIYLLIDSEQVVRLFRYFLTE